MNRQLVEAYILEQPHKVVSTFDLLTGKLAYSGITQGREKKVIDGDEEVVRAFVLTELVNKCGYSPDRIFIETEYTAGRPYTITSRIDIIVRDSKGDAFLFVEAKAPDEYAKIDKDLVIEEQLFKLAGMERQEGHGVKYLVLYTIGEVGSKVVDDCIIIDNKKYPTFEQWVEAERESVNELPVRYGKAQKRPYVKATDKDLETDYTHETLDRLQIDLHNVLWGGGGTDDNEVFSSLTNLILSKIQDEDEKEDGDTYDFQSLVFARDGDDEFETNDVLFGRINGLYRRALKSKLYITDAAELAKSYVVDTKKFSLSKLKYTVQRLEGLSFVDGKNSLSGKDILGDFFEGIIRNGFKQTKGQFFTHINLVRFMLWGLQIDRLAIKRVIEDKEIPYMVDPSAGSGTFLIEYMKFITQNIKYRFRSKIGTSRAVKDKVESDWFYPDNRENKWAQTFIYGAEINFNLGTATKVNMILHGDGSTNIFVKDGLLPFSRYDKENSPSVLESSTPEDQYEKRNVNGQFDLILTNPPFSVDLDNDTKKTLAKGFMFGGKKNSENLFIERWYQLLRDNGRLAAILPDSVFDTTENKYIRLFIYKYFKVKAVVSLPQLAFEPFTPTKTSILFAQKKTRAEVALWNDVWADVSKAYSQLCTRVDNLIDVHDGKKDKAKLPSIKKLTPTQEVSVLRSMLKNYITERDEELDTNGLIVKYREELEGLCAIDKDTQDVFGFVNTWWVFGEVAARLSYPLLMAEADNIGYKRSKRGEKPMLNELFRMGEYETGKYGVLIDDGVKETILDLMRDVQWD